MYIFILLTVNLLRATYVNSMVTCVTPDAENAYCISLFSCPHLMRALGTLEPSALKYVKKSICLGCKTEDFMVCCGTAPNTSRTDVISTSSIKPTVLLNKNYQTQPSPDNLLPSLKYCGFQHTDDRVYNKTKTAIDEFPWLVDIRFSNMEYEYQFADRCSGVLINNRYVLTDAYCGAEAIKVKLGVYNTNQTISCETNKFENDCTDGILDIAVEEIIRNGKPENGPYDFSLLRLSEPVTYTDFIRPICLPLDESKRINPQSLVCTGLGASNATGTSKKRIKFNIQADDACYKKADWLEGNIKFANANLICVAPDNNNKEYFCQGEHGGAFMYETTNLHQWFVEGVVVNVMFSPMDGNNYCTTTDLMNGIQITPDTIAWIRASIRP